MSCLIPIQALIFILPVCGGFLASGAGFTVAVRPLYGWVSGGYLRLAKSLAQAGQSIFNNAHDLGSQGSIGYSGQNTWGFAVGV